MRESQGVLVSASFTATPLPQNSFSLVVVFVVKNADCLDSLDDVPLLPV